MTPPAHGGPRTGSGRKFGSGPYGEKTQQLRVPESQVPTVVAWLDAYRQPTRAEDPRPVSLDTQVNLTAFASQVAAGFPSPCQDYIDNSVDLNAALIVPGHEASTFVLRVANDGWSMIQAGIFPGDRIVVDRALTAQKGDIVVAVVNGSLMTIKTLGEIDGKVALIPENAHLKPITFDQEGDTLEIWGVVTHGLRNFRTRR